MSPTFFHMPTPLVVVTASTGGGARGFPPLVQSPSGQLESRGMATTYVYNYADAAGVGRELLGGKGAGLAQMKALGVPVPDGFAVTTQACVEYMRLGQRLPEGVEHEIDRHVEMLEGQTGKRLGDADDPLLVSVRSGAAVSMPGMMDTILNLGLNAKTAEALGRTTGNARFAWDAYRRLIQMYGEVVDGIEQRRFEDELGRLKDERGAADDVDLAAGDLEELVGDSPRSTWTAARTEFPQDPREQLRRAVRAVFDSWDTPRAQVYRRANGIADDLGTAANVVQMVFGNKGLTSATGVAFTRNPSTGEPGVWGRVPRRTPRGRTSSPGSAPRNPMERMPDALPGAHTASSSRRCSVSRSTTARCRTSSSPWRRASSSCCRREPASAPRPPPCGSRSTWRPMGSSRGRRL